MVAQYSLASLDTLSSGERTTVGATATAAVVTVGVDVLVVEAATTGDEDVNEEAVDAFKRFCFIMFTLKVFKHKEVNY